MARYVDIEPVINQTKFEMLHDKEANSIVKACTLAMLYVLKDIPVADVAPVVRCGNCKYKVSNGDVLYCRNKRGLTVIQNTNNYCNYGVKMGGEDGERNADA